MASKVGPSVATAAAKAALAALCDEASCPKEIFDTGDYSNFTVDRFNSLSPQFACGLASHVLVYANLKTLLTELMETKIQIWRNSKKTKVTCVVIQFASLGL